MRGGSLSLSLGGYFSMSLDNKRSLVETTIFRVKRMLGERLKAHSSGAQRTEVICKCLVINKMNKIGLPKGQWVLKAA